MILDTAGIEFLRCMSIWSLWRNTAAKCLMGDAIERLRRLFAGVCANLESSLVEMDGEDNHVHLLVEYPPKLSVSVLVNSLKGVSSRMLRKGALS